MQTNHPTQTKLHEALQALNPTHLALDNESHAHAGYYDGKESHFKLVIVSDDFEGLRLVARHQKVYTHINPLLTANGGTVHAIAIHAYTNHEWATQQQAPDSPNCAGQNKG